MESAKMHVMLDIKDEFKRIGMDNADVADATHKDKSTVDKQFAEKNGTQTLLTAYGYAEAAGGRVVFLLDSEWEKMMRAEKELSAINAVIADKDNRLSYLAETNNALASQIEAQRKMIERLESNIEKRDAKLEEKDAIISRKDAAIASMLRKSGTIE